MRPADPTLSIAVRVDAACDRFEAEWKADNRPRIDEYLAAAPESDREELRQALLALEFELQGRSEADTSVSRSSVRSDDDPTPAATVARPSNVEPSAGTVGRFEIRGVLGSGAFGKVYRAFDPQLGREVAVKVPLASTVQTEKERAQFLKEARSAANINHPNVCQVHEVGEAEGRPYIVMTLVRGSSLADTIRSRKEPLPEKQAALIVRKIALALAAAHDSGIVHRDLKPANVMFDRERKDIVVMDFGLARGHRLGDARGTQSGVILGTPAYMSPEQARGNSRGVGPASDIFSLGVTLYELLTGTRPFTGTATEVIGQILHVDPAPPSRQRPGIDPRLEAACLKAMAKDPAARFATMKDFAAAIDAALRAPTPVGPAADTAGAGATRREGDVQSADNSNNLAEVFAAFSDDRKQARAETAAAVEAAIAKHRTPRWVFLLVGLLFAGGLTALGGIVFFTRSENVRVTIELTDVDLADKSLSFFLDDEPITAEALAQPVELKPGEHVLVVKRGRDIVQRMLLTVSGGRSPGIRVRDITPPSVAPDDLSRWQGDWQCVEASMGETAYPPEKLKEQAHRQFVSGKARLLQFPMPESRVANWSGTIQLATGNMFDCDDFHREGASNRFRQSGRYELVGDRLRVIYRFGTAGQPLERAKWNDRGTKNVVFFEYARLTSADDPRRWQGRWRSVGEKSRGSTWTQDEVKTANKVMDVKNNRLVIERTINGTFGRYDGTFRLDPAASPRQFDWEGTGPAGAKIRLSGVYEFKGDRLRFIYRNFLAETHQPRAAWSDEKQPSIVWVEFERESADAGFVPQPENLEADRKAAESLLALGNGFVKVNGQDRHIRRVEELPAVPFRLTGVYFAEVKALNDEALACLKDCPHLTELDLRSTRVTEKGLEIFRGRSNFTSLGLAYLRVTDKGLEIFKDNNGLTALFLHDTFLTDKGLSLFHDCTELGTVWVGGTAVTDAGILPFRECRFLKWLDVRATRVTREGVQTMKAALPACRVDSNPETR